MNVTLKFKSTIMTEETYPKSFVVTFAVETFDANDIFKQAHEFEDKLLSGMKPVDVTTECLGITFVQQAHPSELTELARRNIKVLH